MGLTWAIYTRVSVDGVTRQSFFDDECVLSGFETVADSSV